MKRLTIFLIALGFLSFLAGFARADNPEPSSSDITFAVLADLDGNPNEISARELLAIVMMFKILGHVPASD